MKTSDEIWKEMIEITGDEFVSMADVFNCFDSIQLEELLDFLKKEYGD